MVQLSHLCLTTGKTIVWLYGPLSEKWYLCFLICCLGWSWLFFQEARVFFNFMSAVTICSDFWAPQNNVSHCFHYFPIICHEVMEPDAMISVFWMLSFKPAFSFSSFTLIKRFFSSSSHSAFRRVSSAYLRVLLFLLAILIPACESSSLAFYMMYSAYKLNKQGDNIQP